MERFYAAARLASKEAKGLLDNPSSQLFEKLDLIGAGGDRSSRLDLALERIFVKALSPFGQIESEESGLIGEGEYRIILDPLDGSANALSRFPYYGVSIARLDREGLLREAFVANLANGDIFLLNRSLEPMKGSLFRDGYESFNPFSSADIGLFEKAYAHPKIVEALNRSKIKFRSPGAVALSLAYAKSVRFFLFVGPFRIYDFAAGLALCKGLEIVVGESYVLVSKERDLFKSIQTTLLELGVS